MLTVHEWGEPEGEALICLHGVMGDGGRFRRLARDHFAHRRVIAPDLRGHGASTWDPPWDIPTHLADLRETLDAHRAGPADIIGFSFGGRLALELAFTDPDRVRRIALLDPAVRLPPPAAREAADAARADQEFADLDAAVAARLPALHHTPPDVVRDDLAHSLSQGEDGRLHYPVSRSAVVAAYGEMTTAPMLPSDVPTLLIRAAEGVMDDAQERLLSDALGASLTSIGVPGGHQVMWDAYVQVADALVAHLT